MKVENFIISISIGGYIALNEREIMTKKVIFMIVSVFIFTGCSSNTVTFADLPAGNAENGELLYSENINGAPNCATCHSLEDQRLVGPSLGDYGAVADSRIEGQSAEEYTYNAIVRPASHLVDGYSNLMYSEYGTKLAEQDIADLIAFLLTQ